MVQSQLPWLRWRAVINGAVPVLGHGRASCHSASTKFSYYFFMQFGQLNQLSLGSFWIWVWASVEFWESVAVHGKKARLQLPRCRCLTLPAKLLGSWIRWHCGLDSLPGLSLGCWVNYSNWSSAKVNLLVVVGIVLLQPSWHTWTPVLKIQNNSCF